MERVMVFTKGRDLNLLKGLTGYSFTARELITLWTLVSWRIGIHRAIDKEKKLRIPAKFLLKPTMLQITTLLMQKVHHASFLVLHKKRFKAFMHFFNSRNLNLLPNQSIPFPFSWFFQLYIHLYNTNKNKMLQHILLKSKKFHWYIHSY